MRLVRSLALTLLLAAGAGLVWLGVSTTWAARRESRALSAWSPNGLEAIVASFPKAQTNAAAHDLEKASHLLGIDLKPRGGEAAVDDAAGTEKESKTEWGRTRAALTKWMSDCLLYTSPSPRDTR